MITIAQNSDFTDIDRYLIELEKVDEDDLLIPLRFARSPVGFQAALIQLIITWARHKKSNQLIASVTKADKLTSWLQTLCETEYGLVAILMAPEIESPQGTTLNPNSIEEAYRAYRQICAGPRESRDGSFFLVTNRFGKLEHQYDQLSPSRAQPTGIEWFKREVRRQIDRCTSLANAKHVNSDDSRYIADIAYELFANADEWGSYELDGSEIRPNIRGMIVQVHEDPLSGFSQYDETPTSEYLDQWQLTEGSVPKFLEVSIFDAGVGLAQHALCKRVTEETPLQEESDKVLECFRKYSSASGRTFRGLGLYYVMSMLTRTRGFLRYRSGRLSLFRNFHKQPFLPDIGRDAPDPTRRSRLRAKNIYFYDWRTKSPECMRGPSVDGALFTLLFPLRR